MSKVLSSIISIVLSFIFVSLLLVVMGLYPMDFFGAIIKGTTGFDIFTGSTNLYYFGTFIVKMAPIILTGLSVAFAFKTGLFNIGAEGQFIAGSIVAVFMGLTFDLPPVIFPIAIIVVASLAGALWGVVPGILKAWRNVHEVVICIMMNYVALYCANLYFTHVDGFVNSKTPKLNSDALLANDFLRSITNGSYLNLGILVSILGLIVYFIIINKSTLGYKLKVIGFNHNAAKYAGINVKAGMVQAMSISGAFAGAAGAIVILGTFESGQQLGAFQNFGFDGLTVALVGGGSTIGTILASMLFSSLATSQSIMQTYNIPQEITLLISGVIIFLISLSLVTEDKLETWKRKRSIKKEQKKEKGEVE